MKDRKLFARRLQQNLGAVVAFGIMSAGTPLHAMNKVIHEFNGTKGGNPIAQLILDSSGNIYGTAQTGGQVKCTNDCGVVFKLSKTQGGGLAETVLHSFRGGKTDGGGPQAGVVIDGTGNIYGTTYGGGGTGCGTGCGTVYELSPTLAGGWTYSVIYSFTGGADGAQPLSQLVLDSSNNLYGTTLYGGSHGFGGVFELSHSSGTWVETGLYSFTGGTDGANPYAGVIFDNSSNLYGTTWKGGYTGGICENQGCGVVFELSNSSGVWTETVLYTFLGGTDGAYSQAGLTRDALGNLYGTTGTGGVSGGCGGEGCGVVFELSNSSGVWTETVIHTSSPAAAALAPLEEQTLTPPSRLTRSAISMAPLITAVGLESESFSNFLLLLEAGPRRCSILSLVRMANCLYPAWRWTGPAMCSAQPHTEARVRLVSETAASFTKSRRSIFSGCHALSGDRLRRVIAQISESNPQVGMKRIGDAEGEEPLREAEHPESAIAVE